MKTLSLAIPSLLGAVAGNLAYHLIKSYHEAEQVEEGATLPDTKIVGADWVPHSTIAATLLSAHIEQKPRTFAFLSALAFALVAVAASGRQAVPATPSTIVSH